MKADQVLWPDIMCSKLLLQKKSNQGGMFASEGSEMECFLNIPYAMAIFSIKFRDELHIDLYV
jgi:hypothetical protein